MKFTTKKTTEHLDPVAIKKFLKSRGLRVSHIVSDLEIEYHTDYHGINNRIRRGAKIDCDPIAEAIYEWLLNKGLDSLTQNVVYLRSEI